METWPFAQLDGPLYNTREIVQPKGSLHGFGPFAGVLAGERQLAAPPSLPPDEMQVGAPVQVASVAPYEGASQLLTWRTRIILSAGNDQRHPLSNKVEVTLRLADLAREVGLSPAGVAYVKALCGPRHARTHGTLLTRVTHDRSAAACLCADTHLARTRCGW